MYAYIKGILTYKNYPVVILEAGGVGYKISTTTNTITIEHMCVMKFDATVFVGTIAMGNFMRLSTSVKLIIDMSAPSIA